MATMNGQSKTRSGSGIALIATGVVTGVVALGGAAVWLIRMLRERAAKQPKKKEVKAPKKAGKPAKPAETPAETQ